jgi:hypothetical protein
LGAAAIDVFAKADRDERPSKSSKSGGGGSSSKKSKGGGLEGLAPMLGGLIVGQLSKKGKSKH